MLVQLQVGHLAGKLCIRLLDAWQQASKAGCMLLMLEDTYLVLAQIAD